MRTRPLFLIFDFGGVLSSSGFAAVSEYTMIVARETQKAIGDAGVGLDVGSQNDIVRLAHKGILSVFPFAVNKYDAHINGEGKSRWADLECGRIGRDEYVAAFPALARRCMADFILPRAFSRLAKSKTPGVNPEASGAWLSKFLSAFTEHFDASTVLSLLERSPLRANVFALLQWLRGAAKAKSMPLRLGVITNNWRTMNVPEALLSQSQGFAGTPTTSPAAVASTTEAASNGDSRLVHAVGLFDDIVQSYQIGKRKPCRDIFDASRAHLHRTLPQAHDEPYTAFFDDLPVNVAAADAAGIDAPVRVLNSGSVYQGIVDALEAVHWGSELAAEAKEKFEGVFSDAALRRDVVQTEPRANIVPFPPQPAPHIKPLSVAPAAQRLSDDSVESLQQYLSKELPSYFPHRAAFLTEGGPLQMEYFQGGLSNPTFRLTLRTGVFVLRKQPQGGRLLKGAHDIKREFTMMRHLAGTGVPVPTCLLFCDDTTVIGTPFYVMKFVDGTNFRSMEDIVGRGGAIPRQIVESAVDVAVALHKTPPPPVMAEAAAKAAAAALDNRAVGPGVNPVHPLERVVRTWKRQYERSNAQLREKRCEAEGLANDGSFAVPAFEELTLRLGKLLTTGVVPVPAPSLVHGDYKLDNMLFANDGSSTTAHVVALLDFELAHIGDPMADIAYMCLMHYLPPPYGVQGLPEATQELLPGIDEIIERYCAGVGGSSAFASELKTADDRRRVFDIYVAQACHKLCGIGHGACVRAMLGNATDVRGALKLQRMCGDLASLGLALLDTALPTPQSKL